MIIPPLIQPEIAALVRRNQWLERELAKLKETNSALRARVTRQQEAQRERANAEQRNAQRAWAEAERLFG